MRKTFLKLSLGMLAVAGLTLAASAAAPGAVKQLYGHVPAAVSQLISTGRLDATNQIHLAIGLPLRNQAALTSLLQQINDPASPNYHHFLNSEEFNAHFGPSEQDYQAVLDFAKASGLKLTQTHENRMLAEVTGKVSDIESTFNITLRKYKHPTENREFYSPDTEPSVPEGLAVLDVSGLNDYARPHPKLHLKNPTNSVSSRLGSGPQGSYLGSDFRAAYVPGTTLTGAGQKVALVQFDGYLASDIALYEQRAGLPSVSLTNILLNGFSGFPTGTGGEVEVSLDIEMSISMAPGLSQILVYEGDPYNFIPNVVLNKIAVDNSARQVSCSWGWIGGPNATSDQIFLQMALQGQSFYNASGDSDAFLPGQVDDPNQAGYPSSSPYIMQVGATTLTTAGPGGARVSETVWNWGGGVGSSGGISSHYPIPAWQQGFGTSTNHGSTTGRNIPDVALTGDNVYVIADNGIGYPGTGGTSCAAPLWAGFTALINQQAALNGQSAVGFINPAIYALAKSAAYNADFNDITNGNNFWSQSPTNFPAVAGYDLCTGLGTPNGTNLINALAGGTVSTGPIISAPLPPWGANLTLMNGSNPNGDWFLFVQDDKPLDVGTISGGWFITLTTANPVGYAADNQLYITPASALVASNANWTVNLAVTNYGPSTSTNVFVTDALPASGVVLVSSNLTTGTIQMVGNNLVWTIGNLPINTGASLALNFLATAGGTYTTTATVSATTSDPNPDNNTVDSTLLVSGAVVPPQLTPHVAAGSGGAFRLTVTTSSGQPVIIQGSTNLVNWIPIYTNLSGGSFDFTRFDSTNYPIRFYRAVTGP